MLIYLIFYAAGLSVLNGEKFVPHLHCPCLGIAPKSIKINLLTEKNDVGRWDTTITAYGDNEKLPNGLNLTVKQYYNQDKQDLDLRIEGEFELECPKISPHDLTYTTSGEHLEFHMKKGSNIKISNYGRTAERRNPKSEYDDAIVITSRPLYDGEFFEVRLDEVINKWSGSFEFGVTTKNPIELPLHSYFGEYNNETILFYSYQNTTKNHKDIPKLTNVQKGDLFGVKKTSDGEIMFYVNGKHVVSADKKITEDIYVVVDLYAKAVKATIVNPPKIAGLE